MPAGIGSVINCVASDEAIEDSSEFAEMPQVTIRPATTATSIILFIASLRIVRAGPTLISRMELPKSVMIDHQLKCFHCIQRIRRSGRALISMGISIAERCGMSALDDMALLIVAHRKHFSSSERA